VAVLFEMLRPGGQLLFSNAVPDIRDVGYMEAFMGWWLIYRTFDELVEIAGGIPREEIAMQNVFMENNRNWALLHLKKC
jgi:hypothetical protein